MRVKDRKTCARMLEHAARLLHERTRSALDAYSKKYTDADTMDFCRRHPSLANAVKHVFEENQDGKVGRLLSPGYMSGLIYLMAASATSDDSPYYENPAGTEEMLDFSRFRQACDLVTLAAKGDQRFQPLNSAIATMMNSDYGITVDERIDLLVNAWNAEVAGKLLTQEALGLEMQSYRKPDGVAAQMLCLIGSQIDTLHNCRIRSWKDRPSVGGIDLGAPN